MPQQMQYSVLTVALACAVLFRITPAAAGPWMERLHGTMGSFSQVVRLGTIDVPRAGQGSREHNASAMALLLFLSGMLLGVFGGMLLGLVVLPRWQHQQQRQRELDTSSCNFTCSSGRGSMGNILSEVREHASTCPS
jgi:hypothetical protein